MYQCTLRRFLVTVRGMTYFQPGGFSMAKTKVAVTLDSQTLRRVDRLVRDARYPNRSQAIEAAIAAQLERLERRRLADECAKLLMLSSK